MSRPLNRPPPGTRADYSHTTPITTRWMDNDVFGHVNNVTYYSYFDTAVCLRLVACGILTWRGGPHLLMVAESGCRFHGELAFPDGIVCATRLARLGTSSITHEVAIFREGDGTARAEGFMVHVCVDAAARRPAPMPESWRTALSHTGD